MNVFDLYAKLGLDKTEYEKGLDDAKGQAEKSGGGIGQAISNGMKVVAGAAAAGTAAITAFAGTSVKTGMEFDTAMSQVAATMGKTVDDLTNEVGTTETSFGHFEGSLRDFAQFLGSNTAFSATQAAEALNYMALAGYTTQQSMDMLPNVLSLAAAGGIDLAHASDMVTDAQSALGLTAEETAELVDKMAMASSKTNTNVGQLGEAILTVGGTAKNLAGGTTELTQALGLLADNGIKGAEGGTALRNMILSLSAPTDQAAKLMKELGLEVFDAQGNMRPLNDIFGDLNDKLATMTQEGRTNVLNEIFNKVDLKSANALLGTSAERWDQVAAAIDNAKGAAAQMADTQLDNLAGDVTLFKSAMEGAKIVISDVLTPSLREFVQFGTDSVSKLSEAFKEDGLEGALRELKPIIEHGIELVFSYLPKAIEAGVKLVQALVEGIITNLPKLITAGAEIIAKLAQSISLNIHELLDAGIQIVLSLMEGITEAAPRVMSAIVRVIRTIVLKLTDPETFQQLLEAAGNMIQTLADGFVTNLPKIVGAIVKLFEFIATAITENLPQLLASGMEILQQIVTAITDNLPQIIPAAIAVIKALADALIGALPNLITPGLEIMRQIVDTILENLPQLLDAAVEVILALADGLIEALPELIPAIVQIIITIVEKLTEPETLTKLVLAAVEIIIALANGLIQAIPQLLEAIPQIISNLVGAIIANLPTILSAGVQILVSLVTGILGALPQLIALAPKLLAALVGGIVQGIKTIVEVGGQVVDGFLKGIKDAWNGMVENVKNFFTGFIDSIKELFGIHSPSTVFADIGNNLIEGMINGIKDKAQELWDSVREVVGGIWNTINDTIDAAKQWGSDMLQNFMGGVAEKGKALLEKVKGVAQSIRDLIGFSEPKEGPLSNFHTYAPDMMKLFAKGIKDNEGLVTAQISRSFNFEPQLRGASPALAGGPTTNTWNITVNGIDELEEIVRWYQGRQVEERMK